MANKRLGAGDAFFLQIEKANTPMHVAILQRYELPPGKDKSFILELVNAWRQYVPETAPFNLRLANNPMKGVAPEWETAEYIDIDYHLRHIALPQPGGERELAVLVSRLHSSHLDRGRPMWECTVIEGLEGNTFAVYAKMHHALVDGVAGARLMERVLSDSPDDDSLVPYWTLEKERKGSGGNKGGDAAAATAFDQAKDAAESMLRIGNALKHSVQGARNSDMPGLVAPYSAPDCVFNLPIGPQRRVSTLDVKTDRLLKIGKALGGTLNDVVMAVSAGALRGYLQEINELPDKPLIAQVPVSVRAAEDQGGGNAISAILCSLGTDETDLAQRFATIKQSMTAGKTLLREMSKAEITAYTGLLMAPFTIGQLTGIGNRQHRPMFNVVISNVPGPRKTKYLCGAKLLTAHPVSLIMQGQAMNITLLTYDDQIAFVFTACRQSLPSVQKLVKYTEQALDELEKAAGL